MKSDFKLLCTGMLVSVLCVAFTGCDRRLPKSQKLGDVPYTEIDRISLNDESRYSFVDESRVIVINSDAELKKYIHEEFPYPDIDFRKKTLLIAAGPADEYVSEEWVLDFQRVATDRYKLDVGLSLTIFTAYLPFWELGIVTDKISADSKFELNR